LYYVNIAWGSFWCERWQQLFAFLLYQLKNNRLNKISNVLCTSWQPKTTSALDSGTKQKTGDFEARKNWVLFCGDKMT